MAQPTRRSGTARYSPETLQSAVRTHGADIDAASQDALLHLGAMLAALELRGLQRCRTEDAWGILRLLAALV